MRRELGSHVVQPTDVEPFARRVRVRQRLIDDVRCFVPLTDGKVGLRQQAQEPGVKLPRPRRRCRRHSALHEFRCLAAAGVSTRQPISARAQACNNAKPCSTLRSSFSSARCRTVFVSFRSSRVAAANTRASTSVKGCENSRACVTASFTDVIRHVAEWLRGRLRSPVAV